MERQEEKLQRGSTRNAHCSIANMIIKLKIYNTYYVQQTTHDQNAPLKAQMPSKASNSSEWQQLEVGLVAALLV